ncbi:MAG: TIGR02266 family protein [Myxococcales bacterium]|nr:TIGR02266 family protein [Myxococcales bacterium]
MSSAGDENDKKHGTPGARASIPPGAPGERASVPPDGQERRSYARFDVTWAVDYADGETFLYSYITNISEMGIFIASKVPPPLGHRLTLKFAPPGEEPLNLEGEVAWINPVREDGENLNPGFGVRFVNLDAEHRERIVGLVHAIAYLPDEEG